MQDINQDFRGIFFLIIHVLILISVLINSSFFSKKDGFDKDGFTIAGIIAMLVFVLSIILLIIFIGNETVKPEKYSIQYIGLGITFIAYLIPFFTDCSDPLSKSKIKINHIGWITIALGFSGFTSSIYNRFSSHVEDYISVLAQLITLTAGLIGIFGETIHNDVKNTSEESKINKNDTPKITDLGKLAFTVLLIGFAVSSLNSILSQKSSRELADEIVVAKKGITELITDINFMKGDSGMANLQKNLQLIFDTSALISYQLNQASSVIGAVNQTLNNLVAIPKSIDSIKKRVIDSVPTKNDFKIMSTTVSSKYQLIADDLIKTKTTFNSTDSILESNINDRTLTRNFDLYKDSVRNNFTTNDTFTKYKRETKGLLQIKADTNFVNNKLDLYVANFLSNKLEAQSRIIKAYEERIKALELLKAADTQNPVTPKTDSSKTQ